MTAIGVEPGRLRELAARYGTPTHVLDLAKLDANARAFADAWSACRVPMDIFYSVKTNYLPLVCFRLAAHGFGADVVSGHELDLALRVGIAPSNIVFNGPMKTVAEVEQAVELGVRVNVDAIDDIAAIEKCAPSSPVGVGLRVHAGRNVYSSADPSYAESAEWRAARSKFGWPVDDTSTQEVIERMASSSTVELRGIHCHLGSQITDVAALVAAIRPVFALTASLMARHPIETINIGGGFGVPGIHRSRVGALGELSTRLGGPNLDRRDTFDLDAFVAAIDELVADHGLEGIRLACEPGRYVVSDAMALLTTVVSVKRQALGTWVVLDGGLNLIPTGGLGEERRISAVDDAGRERATYFVGGPLCYEADVLTYRASLPEDLAEGELVAVHDTGAYTVSRATNFIRPRAGVVAVEAERDELCWRAESSDDIFAFHRETSFERTP